MPKIESTSQISKVAKMEVATPSGLLWQIESWDHKQHLKKKKKEKKKKAFRASILSSAL